MGSVSAPTVRFRHSAAISVASVIMLISGLSLVTWVPPVVLLVLVAPLAVAVWAWRTGTDADAGGLTVRATLGRRRIPWSDVAGLVTDDDGQVRAQLTSGRAVPLPAVGRGDLARLVAATGQDLTTDPS
jgi:hypothetical protein